MGKIILMKASLEDLASKDAPPQLRRQMENPDRDFAERA